MLIDRPYYRKLLQESFEVPLIKVLTGQRRAGKSSLLRLIAQEQPTYILDMEDFSHHELNTTGKLHKHLITKTSDYQVICIDEVQQVTGREKVIISLNKQYPSIQRIVTGSNSHMLSSELTTLLRGRYIQIHVYPFNYTEFCRYEKCNPSYESFELYIHKGSFPITYLFQEGQLRKQWIQDMIETIFLKDIIERYAIKQPELLRELFLYIINNAGNITSLSSIVQTITSHSKTTLPTLQEYVTYLEQTYLIYRAELFDIRGKKIFDRLSKRYPSDHSWRRLFFGEFDSGSGKILENIIYMRARSTGWSISVGRIHQQEVDFILHKHGKTIYLQVAYLLSNEKVIAREFSSLEKIDDHWPKYIVSLDHINHGFIQTIPHINARNLGDILEG
ncbi:MAG TPA: ATP-binding protein [Candidatus Absconditabacterales bacterium]|nr:ATP-binding protein [Candidatus Absconditabacterales bacterium]HNG97323.1 ATP-binding protein [Candidatus Absconditabacterales bacterium]